MSLRDRLKPYAQWATWPYRNSPEEDIKTMLTGAEAATHIEQDLLAIIGEDVPSEQVITNRPFFHGINFTKQELRTAITAYCKGETK